MTKSEPLEALKTQAPQYAPAVNELEHERDEYKKLYLLLREENEHLKRGLLGQKADRLPKNDAQLSLAILDMCLGAQTEV